MIKSIFKNPRKFVLSAILFFSLVHLVIPSAVMAVPLSASVATAPSKVDLSAGSPSDWIHWGYVPVKLDRKAGVAMQITDYVATGGADPGSVEGLASGYSWSDGLSPASNISGTQTGKRVFQVGKGFEFTVPAGTTSKTLRVYVGANNAQGKLTATLSDGSAPAYSTLIDSRNGQRSHVVTLNFRAGAAGKKLVVTYAVTARYTNKGAYITLESAALDSVGGAGGSSLAGTSAVAPGNVSLTAVGKTDWVHWGRISDEPWDRRAGIIPLIGDLDTIGFDVSPTPTTADVAYSWTGGMPSASVSGTNSTMRIFDRYKGFKITAPADTTSRTLQVYLGLIGSSWGKITATLSDGSAAAYTTTLKQNSSGRSTYVFTLKYQAASSGKSIIVTYERVNDRMPTSGITLGAVKLFGPPAGGGGAPVNNPPKLVFIGSQTAVEGDLLTVPVKASDSDSAGISLSQTNTLPGNPSILSDFGNGIGELSWTPSIGDAAGSPFSVTVVATDTEGATAKGTFNINVKAQGVSGGGALSISSSLAPSNVNLTNEGTADWVLWGMNSAGDVDRKVGTPQIGDLSPIGGAVMPRGTNGSTVYSWTDGMPTSSMTNVRSGLRVYNEGKGFEFSVPAGTTAKSLRVYVGAKAVSGRFEVSLSDGSAPARVSTIDAIGGIKNNVLMINFKAASAGQLLMVRYINENKPGSAGWISLASATLQDGGAGGGAGGMLSGNPVNAPSIVNLSNIGSSDWIHVGLNRASDLNRKVGSYLISDVSAIAGATMPRGANGMTVYSWAGGTPTATVINTRSGLRVYNVNKGFEFTVPADTTTQTLKVYVGAKNVSGLLTATLSDGSAPAYTVQVDQLDGVTSQVITLNFQAATAGEELTVQYVLSAKPDSTGWISLESAALN